MSQDGIREAGITLFYHMSTHVSDATDHYPPARQFFSACIEILGQVCLRNIIETICWSEDLKFICGWTSKILAKSSKTRGNCYLKSLFQPHDVYSMLASALPKPD
jgi:hypothetical protein